MQESRSAMRRLIPSRGTAGGSGDRSASTRTAPVSPATVPRWSPMVNAAVPATRWSVTPSPDPSPASRATMKQ